MSTTPHETRLAELLGQLDLSQADLARRSRVSSATVARAVRGEQISARPRAQIVAALNARREEMQQPALGASDIFPTG